MYWSTQYQLSSNTAAVFEEKRPEGHRRSLHRRHTQHQTRPWPIPQRSASADQRPLTSHPDQNEKSSKPKKRLSFRKNLTRVAKNFNSGLSSLASSLSSLPSSTDEDQNKPSEELHQGLRP